MSWALSAWDTAPHQAITRAALASLAKSEAGRFGAEAEPLTRLYCMYPDRYAEMTRFGFVRRSDGPRTAGEIRIYCVRPDGQVIHGATGDRDTDLASLVHLFERILTHLSENRPAEAAKYAGVLSHFIADSLSPPHAVSQEELLAMRPAEASETQLHGIIERSIPAFTLEGRAPRAVAAHLVPGASAILDACYEGAAQNARDLPAMVKAAVAHDQAALDPYRLRAGKRAAEILADALYTLLAIGP